MTGGTGKSEGLLGDAARLANLLRSGHPCIVLTTPEEDEALQIARDAAALAGQDAWLWSFTRGIYDGLMLHGRPGVGASEHPAAAFDHAIRSIDLRLLVMLDLPSHLSDAKVARLLRDAVRAFADRGGSLVLVHAEGELPWAIQSHAASFELTLPDAEELREVAKATLREHRRDGRLDLAITREDFDVMVRNLRGLTRRQAAQVVREAVGDRRLSAADLNIVLAAKRRALSGRGVLEYVEAPATLDEIGGMRRLKRWLELRRGLDSERAEAFGLSPPRGVLMLGVQGAGKSLCAKAIATAWQWPLLRLDPGALYDRYIGESERRLRDTLHQAEAMAPIVLWIDEIEKGFASAASRSADGGLSQRMFGTLLTWMQEHDHPVFLVATANDIEALPPELLRKGRFDEVFFVDLPGPEARRQILRIHLQRRKRDPDAFDLDRLVDVSDGYSGAEIEQAIISALYDAFADGRSLDTEGLEAVLRASPPLSITMAEKVAALRRWAKGRCVPAD